MHTAQKRPSSGAPRHLLPEEEGFARGLPELHRKTSGNKPEWLFLDLLAAFELLALVFGGSEAGAAFEQSRKRAEAVKPYSKAGFGDGNTLLQHFFRSFDPHVG